MKVILTLALIAGFEVFNINTNFSGTWNKSKPGSAFTLHLHQSGSNITGSHVSVQKNGDRIDSGFDSADVTITGTINSSSKIATVTFKSGYCNKKGIATIRRINANQIVWKIKNPPPGEYYIPNIDTLTKQ